MIFRIKQYSQMMVRMDTYWIRYWRTAHKDVAFLMLGLMACVLLLACDMHEKSALSPNRMQVIEDNYSEQVSIEQANADYMDVLAGRYDKIGRGPFQLTVTYDPAASKNTAMLARSQASRIVSGLNERGIQDIDVMVLPVIGQGEDMNVLVDYDSYTAKPPEDCGNLMAGMENKTIEADPEYKLGCSVETVLSRQIARPRDLAGIIDESPISDGRRASKIIEIYRAGSKDQKLDGFSASK
jgi:type IV pilus biogenesis protein CpaD/CtpE